MCHLLLGSLGVEGANKPVVVQDMSKACLARDRRVWDTHVKDNSIGWWYSIKYLTRSSTCEGSAVVKRFICCFVGLKESRERAEAIVIGRFVSCYNPNSMNKIK